MGILDLKNIDAPNSKILYGIWIQIFFFRFLNFSSPLFLMGMAGGAAFKGVVVFKRFWVGGKLFLEV